MRRALWILSTPVIAGGLAWAVNAADEHDMLVAKAPSAQTGKVHYFSRSGKVATDSTTAKSRASASTEETESDADTAVADAAPAKFVRNRNGQSAATPARPKNVYQDLFGDTTTESRPTASRKAAPAPATASRKPQRRSIDDLVANEASPELGSELPPEEPQLPASDEGVELVRGAGGRADVLHADHKAPIGARNSVKHVQHTDKKSADSGSSLDDLDDELADSIEEEEVAPAPAPPTTPKTTRAPVTKTSPRPPVTAKAPSPAPQRAARTITPVSAAAKARLVRKTETAQDSNAAPAPSHEAPATAAPAPQSSAAPGESRDVPAITLKWVKISAVNVMQECKCGLVVKNNGKVPAKDLQVEAFFPETVRLMDAVPFPNDRKKHLTWVFDALEAGEEKTIEITLIPLRRGELNTSASVRYTGVATNVMMVEEPQLSVAIAGPRDVMVGEPMTQEITVSNSGTGIAQDVVVHAFIPEGLEHPRGKNVEMGIGSLGPGESRPVRLQLSAIAGGETLLKVEARGTNLVQTAQTQIKVAAPKLKVEVGGPALRYVNRAAQFLITITNEGVAATDNVRVVHLIPKGFEYVKSDRAGKFDSSTAAVTWFVGRLEAGQTLQLACDLTARQIGEYKQLVHASGENGTRAAAELDTRVDGASAIVMEVTDLDDPVEVGAQTAYEIKIRNNGSKAAQNLRLACELPQGVELIDTEGPTAAALEKGVLHFRPLGELAAGGKAVFRVKVSGKTPGNLRLRAKLLANASTEPLIVEELTKFYAD